MVALCATAVRDWLLDRDELPEEPLVAMIPVSVRTEEETGTFGNRISTMIVPIPTNVKDPRERLHARPRVPAGAKERHQALPADLLTDATSFIPPAVAARAARTTMDILGRTRPPLNLVISNVPGPRDPLYCAGAQLQANFPVSVVIDGVGLNMTVMSYRDHVDFGIIADRDQVDDAWALMDGTARRARRARDRDLRQAGGGRERPPPVCAHTRLGDPADTAVVVAGEGRGARGDQQGGAGEHERERGVAAVGLGPRGRPGRRATSVGGRRRVGRRHGERRSRARRPGRRWRRPA